MSDYDVIVIGSGAGGGTLVRHLAPSGKRVLLLERGDWLAARAAELAGPRRVRRQPLRVPGHVVRRARQGVPAAGALLRRRRHEALRRRAVPAARGGLRRAAPPRRDLARVADRLRARWSPTTRSPSSSTRCTARAARIRPSRPSSAPYPFPAVSHEPRIQQLSDDLEAAGLRPVPRAVRRAPARVATCRTATACGAPPATASRAWCTRSPTPRCSASGRRSSTPT